MFNADALFNYEYQRQQSQLEFTRAKKITKKNR